MRTFLLGVAVGLIISGLAAMLFGGSCLMNVYSTSQTSPTQYSTTLATLPAPSPAASIPAPPVPATLPASSDSRTPEWDLDDIGTVFLDEETKVILFSPIGAKEQVVLLDPEPGILGKVNHFDTLEIRAVGGENNTYLVCEFRRPRSFLNGVEEPTTPWIVAHRKDACP